MSRNPKLIEAQPLQIKVLSNTASALTAAQPYVRTIDATTNFLKNNATSLLGINLKLVDGAGTAYQGLVSVGVIAAGGPTLRNNLGFAASVGSLASLQNTGTPTSSGAMFLTASTGILTATIEFSAAVPAGATVVISVGPYQIVATIVVT